MRRRKEARTTLLFFFTSGWDTHLSKTFFKVSVCCCVIICVYVVVEVCFCCLNSPTAMSRKVIDRTQGAEGPLRAAVRQSRRVAMERAQTESLSHIQRVKVEGGVKLNHINSSTQKTHLILKKLLKEEFPLLTKTSSFSRFYRNNRW